VGQFAIDLFAVLLALTVLYGSPATVLAVLVGTVMLVPAPLVTPHLHTSYATVDHVVIGAAALRMAGMARRRVMSRDAFRATPLHLAFALLAVTWAGAGIVFAGTTEVSATAEQRMINLAFTVAFFVVTLALFRELDDPWFAMRLLTGTLAITAVIAVIEHFTRDSFGHWVFGIAGHPGEVDASHVLETRAGHVRVRASGEFALAYGWIAVMLLPIATVVALRMRRFVRVGVPVVAVVVLAIYWTYSRSAAAAVPAIFLLLALAIRDRRTLTAGGLTALGALVLFAANSTVHHHLSLSTDSGSVGIRFQRLPPILEAVSHHPYLGLGLGGLQSIAVSTTDNFYLSAYGETGVVGAAILIAVCLTALAQTARGITVTDTMRRAVIATSVLGFVAFLVSGFFDDALLLGQPSQLAVLLLALATATAEPELGFALLPKWSTPRAIFLTATGTLVGAAAYFLAPVVVSQERTFTTVAPLGIVISGGGGVGQSLIGTVCDIAKAITPALPDTHIDCRDNYTAPGVGTLRVESPSTGETLHAYDLLDTELSRVYYLASYETQPTGDPISSRETLWNTAPVSGGVLGFALAFIAPLPIRRRKPASVPDAEPVGPEPAGEDSDDQPAPVRRPPTAPSGTGLRRPSPATGTGLAGTGLRPPRKPRTAPSRTSPTPAPSGTSRPAAPPRAAPPTPPERPARPDIPALDP
jgi:hypothetical protein